VSKDLRDPGLASGLASVSIEDILKRGFSTPWRRAFRSPCPSSGTWTELIGANGPGKSNLIRLMSGEQHRCLTNALKFVERVASTI
jgi:hypothetical protein